MRIGKKENVEIIQKRAVMPLDTEKRQKKPPPIEGGDTGKVWLEEKTVYAAG